MVERLKLMSHVIKLRLKVIWADNDRHEWLTFKTVKDLDVNTIQGDGIGFYNMYNPEGRCDVNVNELKQHLENLKTKYSSPNNTQLIDYEIKFYEFEI